MWFNTDCAHYEQTYSYDWETFSTTVTKCQSNTHILLDTAFNVMHLLSERLAYHYVQSNQQWNNETENKSASPIESGIPVGQMGIPLEWEVLL